MSSELDSFDDSSCDFGFFTVVELGCAHIGMPCEFLGIFEFSTILLVDGDAGSAERMVADGCGQSCGFAASLDHSEHIGSAHRVAGECSCSSLGALEEGGFPFGECSGFQVCP